MNADPAFDRPRLARGVRLHDDHTRGRLVLLAPETVFELNATSAEIIRCCNGERTLAEIIDDLAARFEAPRDRIAADVSDLIDNLRGKRLIAG